MFVQKRKEEEAAAKAIIDRIAAKLSSSGKGGCQGCTGCT